MWKVVKRSASGLCQEGAEMLTMQTKLCNFHHETLNCLILAVGLEHFGHLNKEAQISFSLATLSQLLQRGIPRCSSASWVFLCVSFWWEVPTTHKPTLTQMDRSKNIITLFLYDG